MQIYYEKKTSVITAAILYFCCHIYGYVFDFYVFIIYYISECLDIISSNNNDVVNNDDLNISYVHCMYIRK